VFAVGRGFLADATAADEDLGLQVLVVLTGFALHVIDRAPEFNVRIEAENHGVNLQFPRAGNMSAKPMKPKCRMRI
jgi:hypothetical protein